MANLYELLEKSEPIFVTNHTGGMLLLEFQQEGAKNRRFSARVPPVTDHPMRLDTIVPYSILKFDHAVLHNWIQKEALQLHDPKDVKEHYKSDPDLAPAVQDVLTRANQERKFAVKDIGLKVASGAMEDAMHKAGKKGTVGKHGARKAAGVDDADAEADVVPIHPKLAQAVASLKEDPDLHQEVLSRLRVMDKSALTEAALWHVVNECKNFPGILKWAKNLLAKDFGNPEA